MSLTGVDFENWSKENRNNCDATSNSNHPRITGADGANIRPCHMATSHVGCIILPVQSES